MPRPTLQVESFGSFLFFDEHEKVYLRSPKGEGPRSPGPNGEDWGGPSADPELRDLIWHAYTNWWLRDGFWGGPPRLLIGLSYDDNRCTSFPLTDEEYARLREMVEAR